MKKYPCGTYGRQRLRFFPAPYRAPLKAFAGLVFPWEEDKVLLCDIADRGWCVPSGRIEPGETSVEAVRREAREEAGITLGCVQYLGCYEVAERGEIRWVDVHAARIAGWEEIGMPEESLGRRLCTLDELPAIYHLWNDLTKAVFELSFEVVERQRRCG